MMGATGVISRFGSFELVNLGFLILVMMAVENYHCGLAAHRCHLASAPWRTGILI